MEIFWIFIAVTVVAGLIAATTNGGKTPSQVLNQKFADLGTLSGKTLQEIELTAGPPNSISSILGANGEPIKLIQWIEVAYHICLLFDENDICLGVSSETRINE